MVVVLDELLGALAAGERSVGAGSTEGRADEAGSESGRRRSLVAGNEALLSQRGGCDARDLAGVAPAELLVLLASVSEKVVVEEVEVAASKGESN